MRLLALAATCDRQGQELFGPPSARGWDGGRSWLNSATLVERLNWAADVVGGNAHLSLDPYNPLAWALQQGLAPAQAAWAFVELLLQDDLNAEMRACVLDTGKDGRADGLRKALGLLLHCPEYQLA